MLKTTVYWLIAIVGVLGIIECGGLKDLKLSDSGPDGNTGTDTDTDVDTDTDTDHDAGCGSPIDIAAAFPVPIQDLVADDDGNAYVLGRVESEITINTVSGPVVLDDSYNLFVAKMNTRGEIEWANGTKGGNTYTYYFTADSTGVYITGIFGFNVSVGLYTLNFQGSCGDEIYIAKLDAVDGSAEWLHRIGGPDSDCDQVKGIAIDDTGAIILTGTHEGTTLFGDYTLVTTEPYTNIFLVKMDSITGDFSQPVTEYNDNIFDLNIKEMVTDVVGNTYILGNFQGSLSFPSGFGCYRSSSVGYNIFIAKISPTLDCVWMSTAVADNDPGNKDVAITVDDTGHAYLLGQLHDSASFTPSDSLSIDSTDFFIAQLDGLGNFQWVEPIGGTTEKELHDIAFYGDRLYAVGSLWAPAVFVGTTWLNPNGAASDTLLLRADPSNQGQLDFAFSTGGVGADSLTKLNISHSGILHMAGDFIFPATFGQTTLDSGVAFAWSRSACLFF